MDEAGFDFRPGEKREAKRFEPPPWEKDQFEELARQRAEDERTAPPQELPAVAPQAIVTPEGATPEAATGPPASTVDDARVTEMLAELAAEEPPATRAYWKTSVAVGAGIVAFGAVFVIWGMAALVATRRIGTVGMFGGSVLLLFGAGFVVGGLYVVVKNLRQRGVL